MPQRQPGGQASRRQDKRGRAAMLPVSIGAYALALVREHFPLFALTWPWSHRPPRFPAEPHRESRRRICACS